MQDVRPNYGFHPVLEKDHPYIFIDACMQAWPDAEYHIAHKHGVTAYNVTAWMPHATLEQAVEGIMFWHLIARKTPALSVAVQAGDIRRAKQDGKSVFILGAQDGDFIGNKLHRVEALYRLGLRILLPAYNTANMICSGCLDRTQGGLTRFGRLVVKESNRTGMLLDCSHLAKRSSLDIIAESEEPVVFTHSNVKAIVDNPRNIDDEQIKACAERGGVIGLAPWGPLVLKQTSSEWPSIDDLIDHVDHIAGLTGSTKHIGIGTDLSIGTYPDHGRDPWGEPDYPNPSERYDRTVTSDIRSPRRALRDWNSYPEVVNFIDRLLARGYSPPDIANILGENFLRVFGEVWV